LAKQAGVYQREGFSGLNLLYGGPTVAVEPIIESAKALMGICNSETFAAAVQQGAKLVAVGAYYQHNPFCIASLPSKPIRSARDIVGKRIGIQALNESEWAALLKVNNISPSQVTKVVVQNDPTPLVNGQVDGFLSFVNNQPVTLELKGYQPVLLMLDTIGFTLYQQLYVVTTDSLTNKRDEVTAGLKAEILGKQMFINDPAAAEALTVKEFGTSTGLNASYETKSVALSLPVAQSAATQANGLMYMSQSDIQKNVSTLNLIGLGIPASSYTDEILSTIYANGTNLL
jgi:ABC-type nitrate/sulfonate/bicarbonate transport system substrate-binding protein